MDYENTGSGSHPHRLTFDRQESMVVRAAFREHIFYLALKGNTGSMEDYEANISGWENDGDSRALRPNRPSDVAEVLDDFAERTEEVIQSIPQETGVPAFLNDDIGERHRLGALAMDLADEIREKTANDKLPPMDSIDPVVDDDALNRWMVDDQPS
jgi:hypothetical protein